MAEITAAVRIRLSVVFPDGREDAIDLEVRPWPMPAELFARVYLEPVFARWAALAIERT